MSKIDCWELHTADSDLLLQITNSHMLLASIEERALAGMCGSACCTNPLQAAKPKGTFKIDHQQQRLYKAGDIQFCR